jgi:hypothetical protein
MDRRDMVRDHILDLQAGAVVTPPHEPLREGPPC